VLALLRETAKVMPILDARLLDSDPEGAELLTAILNTKPLQRVYGQARFNPSQRVPVGSRTKRCYDSFSQAKRCGADMLCREGAFGREAGSSMLEGSSALIADMSHNLLMTRKLGFSTGTRRSLSPRLRTGLDQ
jgi:hypothetical protein